MYYVSFEVYPTQNAMSLIGVVNCPIGYRKEISDIYFKTTGLSYFAVFLNEEPVLYVPERFFSLRVLGARSISYIPFSVCLREPDTLKLYADRLKGSPFDKQRVIIPYHFVKES